MPAFFSFLICLFCILIVFSFNFGYHYLCLLFAPLIIILLLFSGKKFLILNLIFVFIISTTAFIKMSPYLIQDVPENLYGKDITIAGKVTDYSEETLYPKSFVISNLKIGETIFSGKVRIYTDEIFPPPYSIVTVSGKLNKISLNSEVYEITNCKYSLLSNKIIVENTLPVLVILNNIRRTIIERTNLSMRSEESFLLLSSILGVSSLSQEERIPFEKTGTSHIFAVSGLHMSILGISLEKFFSLFFVSSSFISLLVLFLFLILVGFKISAFRAILMYGAFVLAKYAGREPNNLNILGVAGLFIVLLSPLSIFLISFQFSFISIFALFVFAPFISKSLPDRWIYKLLAAAISVQIFLFPMISFYFGIFPMFSIFTNLFVIPYMVILVPVGFVQVLVSLIGKNLANISAYVSNFFYHILNEVIKFISNISFSSINFKFSFREVIYFFSVSAFLAVIFARKRKVFLLSIMLLISTFIAFNVSMKSFSIHPYRLGKEDLFVIRNGSSTTLVFLKGQTYGDVASYSIQSVLRREGINGVDLILVNYPVDETNYSKALELLEGGYKVNYFMIPNPDSEFIQVALQQSSKNINLATLTDFSVVNISDYSINLLYRKTQVLLKRNGYNYLFISNSKYTYSIPEQRIKLQALYVPDNFELSNIINNYEFGKLYKY